jgi:hypothetical protein
MGGDKRKSLRQVVDFPVEVEDPHHTIIGLVTNVSADGCFITDPLLTDKEGPELGSEVVIGSVAEEERFEFRAKVVRVVTQGDAHGIGLRFTRIGPEALRGLRRHLVAGKKVQMQARDDAGLEPDEIDISINTEELKLDE